MMVRGMAILGFFAFVAACASSREGAPDSATVTELDGTEATNLEASEANPEASATSPEASETTPGETASAIQGPGAPALIELMRTSDGKRYQDSLAAGVQYVPTTAGETFYAYWAPAGFDPAVDGVLVSLPGHDTFASSAYTVWKSYLTARQYAFIGIQWWFGSGEATEDYLTPDAIYRAITDALAAQGISGTRVAFEGFSRGAANAYAVTALDHASASPHFLVTIANSGGAATNYPPNRAIDAGAFGTLPFGGTHWILYCGGKDPEPDLSGCPAMTDTKAWLEGKGAIVDLFIQDPLGDHGGFHLRPGNTDQALDVYEALLTP